MFESMLPPGAACDVGSGDGHPSAAPGTFRVREVLWRVVDVEAMWREWALGGGDGRRPVDEVSDIEMWRLRAARVEDEGVTVVLVLARDLSTGLWFVHSVWD